MPVLALDIGGTAIKIGVFNDNRELFYTEQQPTNPHLGGRVLLQNVIHIIQNLQAQFGFDKVGISAAGQIDAKLGKVTYATDNIPGWSGICLKEEIEKALTVKVSVENDVNAAALGEMQYGTGTGTDDFLCLTFGTGIGGAIVQNRQIIRGSTGIAGEFGHMITHWGGRECTCGQKGCYEAYASVTALINTARKQFDHPYDGKTLFTVADTSGHIEQESVRQLIHEWIAEVMAGLVSLIYVFNPKLIILGGGIMAQPYITDYINKHLPCHLMQSFRQVKITKARLAGSAGLYGAMHITGCTDGG